MHTFGDLVTSLEIGKRESAPAAAASTEASYYAIGAGILQPTLGTSPLTRLFAGLHHPTCRKPEAPAQGGVNISKRRKFVADGVFYAELNEFFQRELAEEGYSGVEVRVTPTVTDIIIRATHTQEVLGEQGRSIREVSTPLGHILAYLGTTLTSCSLPA